MVKPHIKDMGAGLDLFDGNANILRTIFEEGKAFGKMYGRDAATIGAGAVAADRYFREQKVENKV